MEFTNNQLYGLIAVTIALLPVFWSLHWLLKSTDKDLKRIKELKSQGLL